MRDLPATLFLTIALANLLMGISLQAPGQVIAGVVMVLVWEACNRNERKLKE